MVTALVVSVVLAGLAIACAELYGERRWPHFLRLARRKPSWWLGVAAITLMLAAVGLAFAAGRV